LLEKGMLGAMYWDYTADTEDGELRKAVHSGVYSR
jgi:chitinase